MKKVLYISILTLAALAYNAAGQTFDPTVEVSRTYESILIHTPKPVLEMAVPDSLFRFDLDFDYTVFDRPYRGTGDYKPYLLDLRPEPDAFRGKKLYLRAGAGFSLHPEVDFVYSPETKSRTDLNIYGQHRSYFGKYAFPGDFDFMGHDSYTVVGVGGKTSLDKAEMFYNANYKGIHTKDLRTCTASFNGIEALAGVRSRSGSELFYSAAANVLFAGDKYSIYDKSLGISRLGIDGGAGRVMDDYTIAADLHFSRSSYSFNGVSSSITGWYLAPRYITEKDGFRLNLGVKIGSASGSAHSWFDDLSPMDIHKSQVVYPDLYAAYELRPGELDAYASLTGGDDLTPYEEIRERDHFAVAQVTDNSMVRFNLAAGLRGNISSVLRYDVALGYKVIGNASLYAVAAGSYNVRKVYENMSDPYLKVAFVYDTKPFFVDGNILLRGASVGRSSEKLSDDYLGWQILSPRRFSADFKALYQWKSRIKGGITARLGSGLKGNVEDAVEPLPYLPIIPKSGFDGFVDLGITGEYSLDRTLSVYGMINNLLNKRYLNDCVMPVSGLFVTAGIIVNL